MSLQWLKNQFRRFSTNLCSQDLDFSCQGGINLQNEPTTKPISEQPTIVNWMVFPEVPSMLRAPKPETRPSAAGKQPGEESSPKFQALGSGDTDFPDNLPGNTVSTAKASVRTFLILNHCLSLLVCRRLSG
jgi:hypothetical protein